MLITQVRSVILLDKFSWSLNNSIFGIIGEENFFGSRLYWKFCYRGIEKKKKKTWTDIKKSYEQNDLDMTKFHKPKICWIIIKKKYFPVIAHLITLRAFYKKFCILWEKKLVSKTLFWWNRLSCLFIIMRCWTLKQLWRIT